MIYVEKSAVSLPLVRMLEKEGARMEPVEDGSPVEDKKSNIVITAKKDNFIHLCPGTSEYRCCGYRVADVMQGCPFDCSYCVLQLYLPHKHIRVSADTEGLTGAFAACAAQGGGRLGTGELSDSLALDNVVPLSKIIMPLALKFPQIQFEFKTKSDRIENLLDMNPAGAVVSWSVNPASVVASEEPGAASLERRLKAARLCCDHGYRIGFHFDPIINTENFEELYGRLAEEITDTVPESSVEFVSVSTFRGPPGLADCMRARPRPSTVLKGDFIRGLDGKTRYFKTERARMIRFVINALRKRWKKTFVYMCMEHETLWRRLMGFDPGDRETFEKGFPFYGRKTEKLPDVRINGL